MELSLPVFTTYVCRGWDSNIQPSPWEKNALTGCVTAAVTNKLKDTLDLSKSSDPKYASVVESTVSGNK